MNKHFTHGQSSALSRSKSCHEAPGDLEQSSAASPCRGQRSETQLVAASGSLVRARDGSVPSARQPLASLAAGSMWGPPREHVPVSQPLLIHTTTRPFWTSTHPNDLTGIPSPNQATEVRTPAYLWGSWGGSTIQPLSTALPSDSSTQKLKFTPGTTGSWGPKSVLATITTTRRCFFLP